MLDVRYSTRFKKDFKICKKRNYDMSILQQIVDILRIPETLPTKNRVHNLIGNYVGYLECHLGPDWILIYKQTKTELFLNRTGTHSDLFDM